MADDNKNTKLKRLSGPANVPEDFAKAVADFADEVPSGENHSLRQLLQLAQGRALLAERDLARFFEACSKYARLRNKSDHPTRSATNQNVRVVGVVRQTPFTVARQGLRELYRDVDYGIFTRSTSSEICSCLIEFVNTNVRSDDNYVGHARALARQTFALFSEQSALYFENQASKSLTTRQKRHIAKQRKISLWTALGLQSGERFPVDWRRKIVDVCRKKLKDERCGNWFHGYCSELYQLVWTVLKEVEDAAVKGNFRISQGESQPVDGEYTSVMQLVHTILKGRGVRELIDASKTNLAGGVLHASSPSKVTVGQVVSLDQLKEAGLDSIEKEASETVHSGSMDSHSFFDARAFADTPLLVARALWKKISELMIFENENDERQFRLLLIGYFWIAFRKEFQTEDVWISVVGTSCWNDLAKPRIESTLSNEDAVYLHETEDQWLGRMIDPSVPTPQAAANLARKVRAKLKKFLKNVFIGAEYNAYFEKSTAERLHDIRCEEIRRDEVNCRQALEHVLRAMKVHFSRDPAWLLFIGARDYAFKNEDKYLTAPLELTWPSSLSGRLRDYLRYVLAEHVSIRKAQCKLLILEHSVPGNAPEEETVAALRKLTGEIVELLNLHRGYDPPPKAGASAGITAKSDEDTLVDGSLEDPIDLEENAAEFETEPNVADDLAKLVDSAKPDEGRRGNRNLVWYRLHEIVNFRPDKENSKAWITRFESILNGIEFHNRNGLDKTGVHIFFFGQEPNRADKSAIKSPDIESGEVENESAAQTADDDSIHVILPVWTR